MKRWTVTAILAVLLPVVAVVGVFVGGQALSPGQVLDAIGGHGAPEAVAVVRELRIPRALLGVVVGAGLGTAGALMQAMTRNPLAEPGILGVNAGAAAAVVTGLVVSTAAGGPSSGVAMTFLSFGYAFLGAAAASLLVMVLGGAFKEGTDPVRLTLAGAACAIVLGSYTNAVTLNRPDLFEAFVHWGVGSLQGRGLDVVWPTATIVLPAVVVAGLAGRWLNALALGRDMGTALGADPRRLWVIGGCLVVALAGGATAAAGPISFVGLAAPLAVRSLVGPDYRWVLPLSALAAAIIVLVADLVGRLVMPPTEVETGVVSALIGAPVFIALVRRRRLARL
ncbi:MAG: iron ABC transporter permease [Acidipropionibacterium acidipropionici]|nr:iron ABC transporter permease [Acidipropionibacterium acidipropionici]